MVGVAMKRREFITLVVGAAAQWSEPHVPKFYLSSAL
jgi:hypothetical protein